MPSLLSHPLRPGLRLKLGFFAGALTAIVVAGTAWMTARYFESKLRAVVEEATILDAEELRGVLEEQMQTGDRSALNRLVVDIGHGPEIAWVGVVDDQGRIKVSSHQGSIGGQFASTSPEMQIIGAASPLRPSRTEVLLRDDCSVLRTVTPLPNKESCQTCHSTPTRVVGGLIIDRSLGPLQRAVESSNTQLAVGGIAILLVLLGSLGFAVEYLILRPLARLRAATYRLGASDFAARANEGSTDEIGELSRDFDAMAANLQLATASCASERRQLADLVDGISDGVLLLDPELRCVKVNEGFRRRLGPLPLPDGLAYREIVARAGIEGIADTLPAERALATGALQKQAERIVGPEGDRFEEIYAQPLRSQDGQIAAVVEVWRDITDRKGLEAGLEQSERLAAIGILASSVAHEVGNPLASIVTVVDGMLDRLRRGETASPQEAREDLEIVRHQVFRCRSVTQRLLGLARAPTDRFSTVDVAAVLGGILALVGPQTRAQGVQVTTELAPDLFATAIEQHVEQIVLNLVLNALKAMPEGGVLTVRGWIEEAMVNVRFSDNGPGIPEAIRRKLFQPFVRGRTQQPGAGLGLYICHALVSKCGGAIDAACERRGGATFTIRLPVASLAGERADRPAVAEA
jgi:signal transduction histidine kinase/HAMP domain-containing protein